MCNRKGQDSKETVEYRLQVQLEQPRQAAPRSSEKQTLESASSTPAQTTSDEVASGRSFPPKAAASVSA